MIKQFFNKFIKQEEKVQGCAPAFPPTASGIAVEYPKRTVYTYNDIKKSDVYKDYYQKTYEIENFSYTKQDFK